MTAHRILGCFAFALVLAFPSTAQDTPKGGRIEGEIRNSSGAPIAGATARLGPREGAINQGPSGTSGPDGHFIIENIPEGREYILRVEASGYQGTTYNASGISGVETPLSVQNGSEIKVKIVLTPAGTISGKVVDADGNPVKGMTVTVLRAAYIGGQYRTMPSASTMAANQNEFKFQKLPEGDYYLLAEGRSSFMPSGPTAAPPAPPGETYVDTYFPSSLDRAGAQVLHVAPGIDLSGNIITLRKEKAFAISGLVTDAITGKPAPGISIQAIRQEGGFNAPASVSGQDGVFVFPRLLPGTYAFQPTPSGPVGNTPGSFARQEVSVGDANVSDVRLSFQPDELVTGKISMEDGKPVDAGEIVVALDDRADRNDRTLQAEVKKDGTFEMRLSPSSYAVFVRFGGQGKGYFVSKIKLNGVELKPSSTINIPPGGGNRLELILSSHAAKLAGIVTDSDGKPLGGIPIFARPKTLVESFDKWGVSFAESDQDGRFQIIDLAPGAYYVAALPNLSESDFSDFAHFQIVLDAIAHKADGREEVTLSEDSTGSVTLKISR